MNKPFIVAEASGNHRGELKYALDLVDAAAEAGADAIKLQTFTPAQMARPGYVLEIGPWAGRELVDLYREIYTPRDWHRPIFERARQVGILAFSSVFHPDDVDFLETLECPIYKISSFEITDLPLIAHAARTNKAIIISTGMATQEEISKAVQMIVRSRPWDAAPVTLLKCTSSYPADSSEANLATMRHMDMHHGCDVGISDHTLGIGVAVAATALGATVIEKHLTLRRADGGPDAAFSMEPAEFKQMVTECRRAAAAIGTVHYGPTPGEAASMLLRRKPGGKRGD